MNAVKSVNLHFLTRAQDPETMSMAYQALSGCGERKEISPHEAASMRALADLAAEVLESSAEAGEDWISLLDGFFPFYVIEHIGKEFDLLKISETGEYALNIELKSEEIDMERIRKQLEQNRYYLSHTAHTIFSFTYVLSTGELYSLNSRGYLRPSGADELVKVLRHPAIRGHLEEGIGRFFRSADYLISPVASPEKFLDGHYFLTNQQADFKRRILEHLKKENAPVAGVTGISGTGKTLLLYDLAMEISRKRRILLLHTGMLRRGHCVIDDRLKNVDIRTADEVGHLPEISEYTALLIDEAEYLPSDRLKRMIADARRAGLPVIMAYDPHKLLNELSENKEETKTVGVIRDSCTLHLEFSGYIRINRPVYSFLRTLLNLKDHPGSHDYSCINVLFAKDEAELRAMIRHFRAAGYKLIGGAGMRPGTSDGIADEYDRVMAVLGEELCYDSSMRLISKDGSNERIRMLYEGMSGAREELCLIIRGNEELYRRVLEIRLDRYK